MGPSVAAASALRRQPSHGRPQLLRTGPTKPPSHVRLTTNDNQRTQNLRVAFEIVKLTTEARGFTDLANQGAIKRATFDELICLCSLNRLHYIAVVESKANLRHRVPVYAVLDL
eukprot:1277801-Amphidinium_carterae.1